MTRGSIQFSEERRPWMELLRNIYEFEAIRVAGPGSNHRDINDVLWTVGELLEAEPSIQDRTEDLNELLGWLEENRQMLVIRADDGSVRKVTRVGEIVRLLGHTYEYWHRGRTGIEATRWMVGDKRIPRRSITAPEALQRLVRMVEDEIRTGTDTRNLLTAIEYVVRGTARSLVEGTWEDACFSEFQIEATAEMIKSQFKQGHDRRTQILTAGVGSGKTIGFSMGIMISALEGLLGGERTTRCHLLLYPRTALARDQFSKMMRIAERVQFEALTERVHFEHVDYYRQMGLSARRGIERTYSRSFPCIIVTTLETLKRRLQQPIFVRMLSERLVRVVLDEIHLIEGLTGTQIVHLLERLKTIAPEGGPLWTGSSATVACPDKHASIVFGVPESDVRVVEPLEENMDMAGLVHHVFLRPSGRISTLGCLVNATSILVHNRRCNIGERPDEVSDTCKTIGFADNLDLLGRWNEDLKENERTENDFADPPRRFGRLHPMVENIDQWNIREREVPYALRFHDPLSRRLNVPSGQVSRDGRDERYEPIDLHIDFDPCERCRTGQRISFGNISERDMRALGRVVYREPSNEDDIVRRFSISNPMVFETGPQEIGTLDLCPFLRAGACFWFPREGFDTELIPHTRSFFEYRSVARSRIYSSKVGSLISEDDDLSSMAFMAPVSHIYGPFPNIDLGDALPLTVDMVMSSPSLEVGIDLENVTESFMFKAIRNVSSYRQKAGRAGRELWSDTLNVTLLSSRAMDFHYYRQPRKLISARTLDPIPLKKENPRILRSSSYMAIWDLLALRSDLPESIPLRFPSDGRSEFAVGIERCLRFLDESRRQIFAHLRRMTGPLITDGDLEDAISRARMDLEMFLVPTSGIIEGGNISCIADLVVRKLSDYFQEELDETISMDWQDIYRSNETFDNERPRIDHIGLGLNEEFDSLDRMRKCGWERGRLQEVIRSLEMVDDVNLETMLAVLRGIGRTLEHIETHGDPRVLFFNEQFDQAFSGDKRKAYYLSYIIEDLPIFDGRVGELMFPRPKNLFTNPFEEEVVLREVIRSRNGRIRGRPREIGTAMISEVMHSYIPGTWTYRLGSPMKVDLGHLQGEGRNLLATYDNMTHIGNVFSELRSNVPGPPFFGPNRISLYQPRVLILESAGKYLPARTDRGTIYDHDEDDQEPDEDRRRFVKVPRCFLEGWTHLVTDEGEAIHVNDLWASEMRTISLTDEMIPVRQQNIIHPLRSGLISNTTWHPTMEVIEYTSSVSRSYSSLDVVGSTISFFDRRRRTNIGFGRLLRTEGTCIEMDISTTEQVISGLREALNNDPIWSSSSLKAFKSMLNRVTIDGALISPFITRDVVSLVLFSMIDSLEDITFHRLIDRFGEITSDDDTLRHLARLHVVTKDHEVRQNSEGIDFPPETEEVIQNEVEHICQNARILHGHIPDVAPDLDAFLQEWITYTLLNTFGIAAFQSLQRLCGAEENIGYIPDFENIPGRENGSGRYGIYLYDRDEDGNGSCETLMRYYHILYLQRVAGGGEGRMLPTEDFLTILEQELLQCPQFHTDIGALELHHQRMAGDVRGIPELGYVQEHSEEVESISRDIWEVLGINGREDGWKLPLFSAIPHLVAHHFNVERDDLARATGICWNGCPECVVTDQMLMGPLRGLDYVDKAILDQWFRTGRSGIQEYKDPTPNDIARGEGGLEIGTPSELCIVGEGGRLWRSVSLPFTIGLDVDRNALTEDPLLIVRDNDLSGMRLPGAASRGTARAISIGFGRFVWYDLLMTAYLDSIDCIDEDVKDILMVFYDISDIPFEDIGMSERMWEALEYHRRQAGHIGRLESLSDLIGWLVARRFRITICIDTGRAGHERVSRLLRRLRNMDPTGDNIRILTKDIPEGHMHIKGLVTPVGAIDGSANLTYNGVRRNDESVNHANVGTADYRDITRRLRDAIHGSVEWTEG